jgi:hypothetical protein
MGEPTAQQAEGVDPFFAGYGLARNPFPPARTIIPQVLYNQEEALGKFVSRVKELIQPEPQRRSFGIIGGTGGGKTHFLRHCQELMLNFGRESSHHFITVEFPAGTGSVLQLVREIVRRADEQSRERGEIDLLTALIRNADDLNRFSLVKQPEVRSVMQLLFQANSTDFVPPDRDRALTFDSLREIAKKWLSANALTQTERKYLGVFSRLATPSMAVRAMGELLTLARTLGVFDGMLLCLDEMEALFTSGLSASKVQSFLQDLRYLFDDALRGTTGYSLLIITGSTGNGLTVLTDFNYPLYQRLGLEASARADLQPVANLDDARSFAEAYINYEHERAEELELLAQHTGPGQARALISADELRSAYTAAIGTAPPLARLSGTANQAQLLEALHTVVEEKRRASMVAR